MSESKSEEKTGHKAPKMSGHTDVWSHEIESDLHYHNDNDVSQPLPRERRVPVAQKKSSPCSYDAHNTARGSDEFQRRQQAQFRQENHADARAEAGEEVANRERDCANLTFERRSEHEQCKHVEGEMNHSVMQE